MSGKLNFKTNYEYVVIIEINTITKSGMTWLYLLLKLFTLVQNSLKTNRLLTSNLGSDYWRARFMIRVNIISWKLPFLHSHLSSIKPELKLLINIIQRNSQNSGTSNRQTFGLPLIYQLLQFPEWIVILYKSIEGNH